MRTRSGGERGSEFGPDPGRSDQGEKDYSRTRDKYTPTAEWAVDSGLSPLTQLRRDAPFRPRDWRYQLADVIARHPDPRVRAWLRDRRADAWVEGLLACFADPDVTEHHPAVRARVLPRPANRAVRIEVEARLLAGQGPQEIARKTGLDPEVVVWFESLWFNCRDRLEHPSYVRHFLLGEPPVATADGQFPLELARDYAYFGGPLVLEAVLPVLRAPSERPADPAAAATWAAVLASVTARSLPLEVDAPALLRLAQAELLRESRVRPGGLMLGPLRPPTGA